MEEIKNENSFSQRVGGDEDLPQSESSVKSVLAESEVDNKPRRRSVQELAHTLKERYGRNGNVPPINLLEHSTLVCEHFSLRTITELSKCEGAFGRLWLGLGQDGQQYGLKSISPLFDDRTYIDDIHLRESKREVHCMRDLSHANIVQFYQAKILYSSHLVIKMEYLPKVMKEVCARAWTKRANVRRFAFQIGSALCYLREHNIAHHDLKVQNIMLDREIDSDTLSRSEIEQQISMSQFKLIDFGLAKKYSVENPIDETCRSGTRNYRCLEKAREPLMPYDPYQSDAFSFGVCLLITLIGYNVWHKRICAIKKCDETYKTLYYTSNGQIRMQKVAHEMLFRGEDSNPRVEKRVVYALLDEEQATAERPARITVAQAMEILRGNDRF